MDEKKGQKTQYIYNSFFNIDLFLYLLPGEFISGGIHRLNDLFN